MFLSLPLHADDQSKLLSRFRYIRKASLPEANEESVSSTFSINIDNKFYEHINNLSNDLRIINSQKQQIAFVLSKVTSTATVTREEQLIGKIIRNQPLPDGRTIIDFELESAHDSINMLEIAGGEISKDAVLSISAGDGRNWKVAVDHLALSDTSAVPEITSRKYPFPQPVPGKMVRITLEKGSIKNLEAIRLYTFTASSQPETAVSKSYEITTVRQTADNQSTILTCRTYNLPLTQLRFASSQPFYFCRVTVQGSNDRKKWSNIVSTTIRQVDLESYNTVDFPEKRFQYMKIILEHPQTGQMKDLQLQAWGNSYEWLMPVNYDTRQELTIYYGASGTIPRQLENANIISGQTPTAFNVSPQAANPLYMSGVRGERTKRSLTGALIIAAAGIVFTAVITGLSKLTKVLPED